MSFCCDQTKEPIQQQHTFAARPWSKVGADLCELGERTLLVVTDYYSNFIEVENITRSNGKSICKALMMLFARYSIPDTLMTDNGPQFTSAANSEVVGDFNMSLPLHTIPSRMARECCQDHKTTLYEVRQVGTVGVQSPVGLVQHANRRDEHQPSSAIYGSPVQDITPNNHISTQAQVRHKGGD